MARVNDRDMAFVLGDPNHGAAYVLGEGAAIAAATLGAGHEPGQVSDAVSRVQRDVRKGRHTWPSNGGPAAFDGFDPCGMGGE